MDGEMTLEELFHSLGLKTAFERYLEDGELHGWGQSDSSYLDLKLSETQNCNGKIVIEIPFAINE